MSLIRLPIPPNGNILNSMITYIPIRAHIMAKPRMTRRDVWLKRDCVVRYRDFADELRLQMNENKFILPLDPVIIYFLPIPESWPKKKKDALCGTYHTQKPDIDNLIKSWDSVMKEDKKIHTVFSIKRWSCKEGIRIGSLRELTDVSNCVNMPLCTKHTIPIDGQVKISNG